jgi:hypothetical protein
LGAESTLPDQPITSGAAAGAGPGVDVLGLPQNYLDDESDSARNLSPGEMQALMAASMRDDVPASFKRAVRVALANRMQ